MQKFCKKEALKRSSMTHMRAVSTICSGAFSMALIIMVLFAMVVFCAVLLFKVLLDVVLVHLWCIVLWCPLSWPVQEYINNVYIQ